MTIWQWLTKRILLEDERDIMARIGFRFIWCTGPYFFLALVLSAFGKSKMLLSWPAFFFLAIPFIGGLVDWYRLKGRISM
jgi:hypothetical protein